jgi:gliding motility-associated-like protein
MYSQTKPSPGFQIYSHKGFISLVLVLILIICSTGNSSAQCGAVISTFPYSEGFESAPAWTTGGTNNDWAWGAPVHSTISSAGGGSKCWCVGGLNGSFYNYSELSYIESPCFDFTNLSYPWISLKIFWEDEWKYDGLVLQSSTDGGTTWNNVGTSTDPVDCLNSNWYDYNNITWLTSATPKDGWCGRVGATVGSCQGGHGSGGWVTATHCLAGLANAPSVRFRFLFGAGTTCNSYDGIAVDDIYIDNAPTEVTNFSFVCAGANLVNFTNLSTPCTTNSTWNFGDPASGASNVSTSLNPGHTYPGPGTYTVSLKSSGTCNAPTSISIPVTVLGATTTPQSVSCHGNNDGSATANASGGSGPFTYSWNPGGQTTATTTGLSPGTYTVLVSAANACPSAATVTITEPVVLTSSVTTTAASCGSSTGSATTTPVGGTITYTYSWSPGGATTAGINGVPAGNDTCFVTDAHGCKTSVIATIASSGSLTSAAAPVSATCNLSNGTISTSIAGGSGTYTYSWSPSGGTGPVASNLSPGLYTCTITDAGGCSKTDTATVFNSGSRPVASMTPAGPQAICSGTTVTFTASGGGTYSWNTGVSTSSITVGTAGTYKVVVANSCGKDSVTNVVTILPLPVAAISGPSTFCTGDSVMLTATGGSTYTWNGGIVASSIYAGTAGTYTVVAANTCGTSTTTYTETANSVTALYLADSTSGYAPFHVIFTNSSSPNASTWAWNFGDGTSGTGPNPTHTYGAPGVYTAVLSVTDPQGCTSTYSMIIRVNDLPSFVSVPNVFTPNGDGSNDIFVVKSQGLEDFEIKIYDRWGILLSDFTNPQQGWDGRTKGGVAVTDGTYFFIMNAKGFDGKSYQQNGFLTLLR